jgi:hypothetical protein
VGSLRLLLPVQFALERNTGRGGFAHGTAHTIGFLSQLPRLPADDIQLTFERRDAFTGSFGRLTGFRKRICRVPLGLPGVRNGLLQPFLFPSPRCLGPTDFCFARLRPAFSSRAHSPVVVSVNGTAFSTLHDHHVGRSARR